jgi:hypothetical protein
MKTFREWLFTEENFQSFQDYLRSSGLTFEELLKRLKSGRPDGVGGNANFYKIPGTEFGIRVVGSWGTPDTEPPKLVGASDPFGGENFGQPVANYGNNVQVLRLQHGTPAGKPFGVNHKDSQAESRAVQSFRERILEAASLPDSAYERLMLQIMKLNEKGYMVDSSKSGNLLIDPARGRFNIVDLNHYPDQQVANDGGNIILMLINNYFFEKHQLYSDPEMVKAGQEIIDKVEQACAKTGLPLGKDNGSVEYAYRLVSGDYKPYVAPANQEKSFPAANEVW